MRVLRQVLAATILAVLAGPVLAQAPLPSLPAAIKEAGVLRAGVRCDQPPYGFRGADGGFAGVEVEMARQMAAWAFGAVDKIDLQCVTAENRIPQLNAKRVDLLIATLGVTPERARVIDFSRPYRWGASALLVKKDSPINKLDDVKGRTVVMLRGTTQALWFDANMPELTMLKLNSAAEALQAMQGGRADAYSHDDATLVVIAARDPALRVVKDPYAASEAAVGVRKNEAEWKGWIDAALDRMKGDKLYAKWVVETVPADIRPLYLDAFETAMPKSR